MNSGYSSMESPERSLFPLSVVILAKNEAANIRRCVEAVNWCNDVVVVDDLSSDETAAIAVQCGARVLQHPFKSFAGQRNWAMEAGELRNSWVLHLDADEVMTASLRSEIVARLNGVSTDVAAFCLCRKTMLGQTWLKYSDGFPVWIMRLVRRGFASFRDSGHGEIAVPPVSGTVETLQNPFLHYAFSKGWSDWIRRHNLYSTREAEREVVQAESLNVRNLVSLDKAARRAAFRALSRQLPLRPYLRFCYQYFLKLGFLDGRDGFTFCVAMANYERWIVLKRKELKSGSRENTACGSNS